MKEDLYWIDSKWGCGGIFVKDGIIVGGAPVFKKFIGQSIQKISNYYKIVKEECMAVKENEELHILYRPRSFDEYLGNRVVKEGIKSVIGKTHFFLLYGPRGCGKTTMARLIAPLLKVHPADVHEIDSADKTGVDDARALKSTMNFYAFSGGNKLYIFDEIHRLSGAAFDSLLKILEHPPAHVFFVGCTTEFQKVPATIISRAKVYQVQPLSTKEADDLIKWVCDEEGITLSNNVRQSILENCENIPREIVSAIDKVRNIKNDDDAIMLISIKDNPQIKDLCQALLNKRPWNEISTILKGIQDEPENIRYAVLGYMNTVILGGGKFADWAWAISDTFRESFIYTKRNGLISACFYLIKQ